MANDNQPFGMRAVNKTSGTGIPGKTLTIASGQAGDIKFGDPVKEVGTSSRIEVATAGDANATGYFMGCNYRESATGRMIWSQQWVGGTVTYLAEDVKAIVTADPDVIMEMVCDTLASDDHGKFADWDDGTSTTDVSGRRLVASAAAASGKALRIGRLSNHINRDLSTNAYGAGARVEVTWAKHALIGDGA